MIPDEAADSGDIAAQTARLEAALERIAAASAQRPAHPPQSPDTSRAQLQSVAALLDTAIARLRSALGES